MGMKHLFIFGLMLLFVNSGFGQGRSIIAKNAEVQKLGEGFKFTEGPAVDKEGNVYFTDQPNNKIWKWSTEGELSVFHDDPGRANGLYFDQQGNLLAAADMENQLWLITPEKKVEVLIENFDGKLLNGPNDIWVDPKGGIYFTDPLYKRPYWERDPSMQQEGEYVYYISPDKQEFFRVATDLVKPNGIIGTSNGQKLYVADIGDKKTYVYSINDDGTLSDRQLFTSMGSDGMTIDNKGNIYLTGKGVTVFDPNGKQIEHIDIPENWTANVCFGGKNLKTLFITASESIYGLEMRVKGVL